MSEVCEVTFQLLMGFAMLPWLAMAALLFKAILPPRTLQ